MTEVCNGAHFMKKFMTGVVAQAKRFHVTQKRTVNVRKNPLVRNKTKNSRKNYYVKKSIVFAKNYGKRTKIKKKITS